jgi:1-acyl-sn-glycerol-3-phosphate acyltransferase
MARTNIDRAPSPEDNGALSEREFDEMPTVEMRTGRERLREVAETRTIEDEAATEEVREAITQRFSVPVEAAPDQTRISEYQARSIPAYLKKQQDSEPFAARLYGMFASAEGMKEAREALPKEGPFLVVANHSGGESPVILSLLKEYDAHIAAGEELNFNRSGFRKWLLQKMRMIPVRESLANLNEKEKEELLERVPGEKRKESYRKIVEREKGGSAPTNREFVRAATALLSRGDVVVMFPEGLFLYDDNKGLRRAYGGVELIAREFKRLTGRELPIVPVSVWNNEEGRQIEVGDKFILGDIGKKRSGTDQIMRELAELLPDELQGEYGE